MTAPATEWRRRRLIVNADDFGQSQGINDGVLACHEHGILTSASLMVRWPWTAAAVEYARGTPALSVGLHLDLGEWIYRNGEWVALYVGAPEDPAGVRTEILRQFETFYRLMGCHPTHIDSHQHVHRHGPAKAVVAEIGNQLRVPIRDLSGTVTYLGGFYGQSRTGTALDGAISVDHLVGMLRTVPEGTTELGCHPGLRRDAPGMYVAQRDEEVRVLCDPRVRAAIQAEGIELISFRDFASAESQRVTT
jgi:predicted glycoside hydrolase/deacetylase ChbG (UPF0249 family)